MQHFILGDTMGSKGKLSAETNTVLMWINTYQSDPKYSKGQIPIRQSLEPELQDGASTSTSSTELHVSNDCASTSTSTITACTANSNLSSSTIGYSEDEGCLIDLDFDDGNSITEKEKGNLLMVYYLQMINYSIYLLYQMRFSFQKRLVCHCLQK